MIVNVHAGRLFAELGAEGVEVVEVFLAQPARIDECALACAFQAAELRPFFERELDLFGSKDVEEQNLMPAMAEIFELLSGNADTTAAIN